MKGSRNVHLPRKITINHSTLSKTRLDRSMRMGDLVGNFMTDEERRKAESNRFDNLMSTIREGIERLVCKDEKEQLMKESSTASQVASLLKDEKVEQEATLVSVLESEYSCAICNGVFIDPSSLLCGHTFCLHCLLQWLVKKKDCPVCREPCALGNNSLPKKNVSMSAMIERTYGELLPSSEDLRTKRAEALKDREKLVKKSTSSRPTNPLRLPGRDDNLRLRTRTMEIRRGIGTRTIREVIGGHLRDGF